jgi:hypothetical protein
MSISDTNDAQQSAATFSTLRPRIEIALEAIENGYSVFPCQWRGLKIKHPITENGFKDASDKISQVTQWWTKWPESLVGLWPGSGIVVLDFDTDVEKGLDAATVQQKVENLLLRPLPETYRAVTRRGGWHLYYRTTEVFTAGSAVLGVRGFDLRGSGGYAVVHGDEAPPHPDDLTELPSAMAIRLSIHRESIKAVPGQCRESLHDVVTTEAARSRLAEIAEKVKALPSGARNESLLKKAILVGGWCGNRELHPDEAEAALNEAVDSWDSADTSHRKTVTNGIDYGIERPLSASPTANWDFSTGNPEMEEVDKLRLAEIEERVTAARLSLASAKKDAADEDAWTKKKMHNAVLGALKVARGALAESRRKKIGLDVAAETAMAEALADEAIYMRAVHLVSIVEAAVAELKNALTARSELIAEIDKLPKILHDWTLPVNIFLDAVACVLAESRRVFILEGQVVYVAKDGTLVYVTATSLPGIVSKYAELYSEQQGFTGGQITTYGPLSETIAKTFLNNPRITEGLPRLKLHTTTPTFDTDFNWIGTPGYHESCGIYYSGPEVEPVEGTVLLEQILAEFPWKDAADKVNFIGACITSVTMLLWPCHPMLAITANRPGVGKSTLAVVLAAIMQGKDSVSAITYTDSDEELEKRIATRVRAGDGIVLIDNVKCEEALSSQVVERCVTSSRLSFRLLGKNEEIARANDVLFALTMNKALLSEDLRRRALPVTLHREMDVVDVEYKQEPIHLALENRTQLLGEVAGMVVRWLAAGRKRGVAKHSVNQTWASTVDGILRHSGYVGLLSNLEKAQQAADPKYNMLLDICEEHHAKPLCNASDWGKALVTGVLREQLVDRNGLQKSSRSQSTTIGMLFTPYVSKLFTLQSGKVYTLTSVQEHNPPQILYAFVPTIGATNQDSKTI